MYHGYVKGTKGWRRAAYYISKVSTLSLRHEKQPTGIDISGIWYRTFTGSQKGQESRFPSKDCLSPSLWWLFASSSEAMVVFGSGDQKVMPSSPSLHPPAGWMQRIPKPWRMVESSFPGGAVDRNPLASVGIMGSIPGPGGSHKPQSN